MTNLAATRTALITGANSGVGFELTKRLLSEQWDVIALIRSDFTLDDPLITRARAEGHLRVYHADLSDFGSLKHALHEIKSCEEQIDVLFNNAAALVRDIHFSPQGREMHFEVNTVVPYILAKELKPLIANSTLKTVVNISSDALLFVRQFNLDLLEHPKHYKPIIGPYGASKLGLSLWTQALAPALLAENIEIRSVNPGPTKSKMTNSPGFPKWMVPLRYFFSHPNVGAGYVDNVARGAWRGKAGLFINKNKAVPIPFGQQGSLVLARVQAIYEHEFLNVEDVVFA